MLEATDGIHFADQVVVASGGYQVPIIPRAAERLRDDIVQIHSSLYRNPAALPQGTFPGVDTTSVYDFLERHSPAAAPPE